MVGEHPDQLPGEIDKAAMSLAEATFEVVLRIDGSPGVVFRGAPFQELQPWRPRQFRVKEFADVDVEFVVEAGTVTAMKQCDPPGEFAFQRR